MTDDDYNNGGPNRRGSWGHGIGILLMLPIGLIAVLVLFFLFGGSSSIRGEWLIIIIAILLVVFVVRISFRRSRRRHWRQQHQGHNGPMRILRERYARGEITKEQFDQMSQDLHQGRHQ
jgi:uncharacterized membrane protein